jgi:hypothetical protein
MVGREMLIRRALIAALMGWALAAGSAAAAGWRPEQGQPFDVQSTAPYNFARTVRTLALGVHETAPTRIQELKARGIHTVCIINAGAWENWRSDAGAYDLRVVGSNYAGWQGARWVDIRAGDVVRPIIAKRLDLCQSKGFDGVLFDNVDGYAHASGFPLTAKDQLAFNRWLAAEAHARGLAAGLMNALDLIPDLVGDFDYVVSEQCSVIDACKLVRPFREADKSAFVIEYTNVRQKMDSYCAAAADLDVQMIFKTQSRNGRIHRRCPPS